MRELEPILAAFHAATDCDVALWVSERGVVRTACSAPRDVPPPTDAMMLPLAGEHARVVVQGRGGSTVALVAGIPATRPGPPPGGPRPGPPPPRGPPGSRSARAPTIPGSTRAGSA
jgi:hypothetical protein